MKCKILPVVRTQRLCLHAPREEDRGDMIGIFTNEEISRTYMTPEFASPEDAVRLFERLRTLSASEDHFVYGIYLNDKLIGLVNDVEMCGQEIELGYVIHPSHKNKGYATEVLKKAMELLFQAGYATVKAGAFDDNAASIRVMEKSGMIPAEQEEQIEYRGKIHRCVYYKKENSLPCV